MRKTLLILLMTIRTSEPGFFERLFSSPPTTAELKNKQSKLEIELKTSNDLIEEKKQELSNIKETLQQLQTEHTSMPALADQAERLRLIDLIGKNESDIEKCSKRLKYHEIHNYELTVELKNLNKQLF